MDQEKSMWLKAVEWGLLAIFLVIWLLLSFHRQGNLRRGYQQFLESLPIDARVWDTAGKTALENVLGELLPLASYGEYMVENVPFLLPFWQDVLEEEMFPIQRYSQDYWEDNDNISTKYSDVVPEYFTESDDSNEETKKEDPGTMSEGGEGQVYSLAELSDPAFLREHFYIIDSTTSMTDGELNGEQLLKTDLSAEYNEEDPCVLIYHTHGSETYKKEKGKEGSVMEVGETLKKELEDTYHIPVLHDTAVYDQVNGELDRSAAYNYAGDSVAAALEKYPSIQVVIDLHRDSVEDDIHLTTEIDGKKTAQIMFFNGVSRLASTGDMEYLYNPNKMDNLAFSLQMQLLAAKYYPDYTRRIYIKGYRYNLHLTRRAMLVEVGAQNNTLTEARNAMKPLAELLYRLLSGEKAWNS